MTAKLRVSEVYLSIQGEGPRVGQPTVFVRFAGCNLRCPGWACDTPHAIDPKLFTKDSEFLSPEEIVLRVKEVAPHGAGICYTGGEPFLRDHQALEALVELLARAGYTTQEAFTNGTIKFPAWVYDWMYLVMDYKLHGAGEEANIHGTEGVHATRILNIQRMSEGDVVKFTIASPRDYLEAAKAAEAIRKGINSIVEFNYGVVWGKLEAKDLIEWVLRDGHDWIYSHQLHNVIWDRDKRGI
jgi:7-carboxy-7-deazaguanine synthase